MKIGILTFHEVFNPGAFLQALATQRLVESLGHEAEIIDYTPTAHRFSLAKTARKISWKLPFKLGWLLTLYRKDLAFANAREELMNLTPQFETRADVSNVEFDCVLIGADVVWNYVIKEYGQDPVYFGDGLNTKKLVSFAPSFGPCSIDDPAPEYVGKGLQRFDHISVRDKNSQQIVEHLIGNKPTIICDPAFHLDVKDLPRVCNESSPFLLIYALPQYMDSKTIGQIRDFAKERGLKIIATLYPQKWADQNRIAEGPLEWLGLLDKADYVFTNTFHGIVFCTKMKKRFAFQYTPSIRTKSLYTVDRLGLKPMLVDSKRTIGKALACDHDFELADEQIACLTADAKKYLVEALR